MSEEIPVPSASTIVQASAAPAWRLKLLHYIQLVVTILAVVASVEAVGVIDFLSTNLITAEQGKALAALFAGIRFAAEPLFKLIGDHVDDGVKNDSFKL